MRNLTFRCSHDIIDSVLISESVHSIEPIDESRDFNVEELFFSTTDLNGRIHRSNGVFRRISGYSWDELKNRPHSIIRHPDMPRVIFQLLWDYIQSGRPIVAYVKNMAHDGRYYWVVALVVPIQNGYLSIRFKPTSPLFATVKDLYSELKAIEASIESDSNDKNAAMAASREVLNNKLGALGVSGYDEFMQQVLKQEMQSREAALPVINQAASPIAGIIENDTDQLAALRAAVRTFDQLLLVLSALFGDLEAYVKINEGVRVKSENVINISESLRTIALSGGVEADKLGTKAAGLRPVLDWLRSFSIQIVKEGTRLSESLVELTQEVDLAVYGLSAAKLQIEMSALFAHELLQLALMGRREDNAGGTADGVIECLHASSTVTVRRALSSLAAVKDRLAALHDSQSKLLKLSHSLRPIYLTGKIELADFAGSRLARVFSDLSDLLNETVANINGLQNLLEGLEARLVGGLANGMLVDETIGQIDSQLPAMLSH
jgi:PAS domain S-box-containing protein